MAIPGTSFIRRMSDSTVLVKHPEEDVRGKEVLDSVGKEIGTVDDLMVDDGESKVRFIRVADGGFLGIGATVFLIPVDAITRVTATAVHIDRTREHVAGGPTYDPDLAADEPDWRHLYNYYGYQPYWQGGYMYPMIPWYSAGSPSPVPKDSNGQPD